MKSLALAAIAALTMLLPRGAEAQDHRHRPGKTGEALGSVQFATSCSPSVAGEFDRAMTLLHSFEFGAALKAYNGVLAGDSTCAMAYWGIALSRWGNPMAAGNKPAALLAQGREAADAGVRLMSHASERERGYLQAVRLLFDDFEHRDQRTRFGAYERAMDEVARRYPDDTEAAIFHALALVASASPADKTYASQLKAGRILEALWVKQPNHPGLAHYIIHAYDAPPLAAHARDAARRYSEIAPSAAHALHMPSHTFTRVGLWQESMDANRRSMATALSTGSIGEALHAADYMMYAALQLGQESEGQAILDRLPGLASRFDPQAVTGAAPGSAGLFALAAIPARWAVERRAWAEAARLEPRATAYPYTEAMTYFARALGAANTGDRPGARAAVDSLAAIQKRLAAAGEGYWAEQVAIQQLAAQAALDLAEGRENEALARMREAVAREDATEKSAVTPGPLAPARELLGDMLVKLGREDEARTEYRAVLAKEPGRRRAVR